MRALFRAKSVFMQVWLIPYETEAVIVALGVNDLGDRFDWNLSVL